MKTLIMKVIVTLLRHLFPGSSSVQDPSIHLVIRFVLPEKENPSTQLYMMTAPKEVWVVLGVAFSTFGTGGHRFSGSDRLDINFTQWNFLHELQLYKLLYKSMFRLVRGVYVDLFVYHPSWGMFNFTPPVEVCPVETFALIILYILHLL